MTIDKQEIRHLMTLLDAIERGPCPECGEYPARSPDTPRWDSDPVVEKLGPSPAKHCPDCGSVLP